MECNAAVYHGRYMMPTSRHSQGRGISEAYPLSPMQHGMLVHSLDVRPAGVDIEQVFCELREEIDVPAFEKAWNKVIARHAILRASFHWLTDGEPQQIVQRLSPLRLQRLHWSDQEWERKWGEFFQADRQKG